MFTPHDPGLAVFAAATAPEPPLALSVATFATALALLVLTFV